MCSTNWKNWINFIFIYSSFFLELARAVWPQLLIFMLFVAVVKISFAVFASKSIEKLSAVLIFNEVQNASSKLVFIICNGRCRTNKKWKDIMSVNVNWFHYIKFNVEATQSTYFHLMIMELTLTMIMLTVKELNGSELCNSHKKD